MPTVPVRLCDIPTHIRLTAAAELARHARDERERVELMHAALHPSTLTYQVPAEAAARLTERNPT